MPITVHAVLETISGRVPPLTKDQLMRGNREAMPGDDQVRVVLQHLPGMHPVEIYILQINRHVHLGGDSEREKSEISDLIN